MSEKKVKVLVCIVSLLFLIVGVWIGGKDRWRIKEMISQSDLTDGEITEFEQSLRDQSDDAVSRYNLAIVSFQQEKYDDAEEVLIDLLNSHEADEEIVKDTLYNLGNISFEKSEQEEVLENRLELLLKSLSYYRAVIEKEKQAEKYSNLKVAKDEDAHFNYVLVRKKIKLLQDKLAQQKKEQERGKQLYQLLKELRAEEADIAEELEMMKAEPFSRETLEKREALLKRRAGTLSKLQVIKEKIIQLIKPQKAPTPAVTTI